MQIYMIYFVLNNLQGRQVMGETIFYKVVCINDNDVFEYRIEEDTNKSTLDEVNDFVKQNIDKYPNCKWLLLPCYC